MDEELRPALSWKDALLRVNELESKLQIAREELKKFESTLIEEKNKFSIMRKIAAEANDYTFDGQQHHFVWASSDKSSFRAIDLEFKDRFKEKYGSLEGEK